MPAGKTGKKYILTIQDGFSRFLYTIPQARNRALDAARGLYTFMLQYGFPSVISSDRGRHFIGEVVKDFANLLNIRQNLHCSFRPQSTGTLERVHRVLKNSLWGVVNDQGCDWEDALPSVTSWINRGYCKSIKSSPWKVIFGYDFNDSGLALPTNSNAASNANQYAKQLRNTLTTAYQMVKLAQSEADSVQERKRPHFTPISIAPGEKVYLKREVSAEAQKTNQPYIGPYKVLKSNDCILLIEKNGRTEFVHRGHVTKYMERSHRQDDDILELLGHGEDDVLPPTPAPRRSTRVSKPVNRLGICSTDK